MKQTFIRRVTEKRTEKSQCRRCKELGIWNVDWTCFMYEIEGRKGYYCWACVRDIEAQERKAKWEHDVQEENAGKRGE